MSNINDQNNDFSFPIKMPEIPDSRIKAVFNQVSGYNSAFVGNQILNQLSKKNLDGVNNFYVSNFDPKELNNRIARQDQQIAQIDKRWTQEQMHFLMENVRYYQDNNQEIDWKSIGVSLGKSADQCKSRYYGIMKSKARKHEISDLQQKIRQLEAQIQQSQTSGISGESTSQSQSAKVTLGDSIGGRTLNPEYKNDAGNWLADNGYSFHPGKLGYQQNRKSISAEKVANIMHKDHPEYFE